MKHPLPPRPQERRELGFGRSTNDRRRVMVAGGKLPTSDWVHSPGFRRRPHDGAPLASREPGQKVVVFDVAGDRLGRRLAKRLEAAGAQLTRVVAGPTFRRTSAAAYTIAPGDPEHYERLFAAVGEVDEVIHLWSLRPGAPQAESMEIEQETRLFSLLRLSGALRKLGPKPRLSVVTTGLYPVLGDETLAPVNAGVAMFATVATQEQPGARMRLVELRADALAEDDPEQLAGDVLGALDAAEGGALALRGRRQWTACFDRVQLDGARPGPEMRAGGAYLIVGGLGELGLMLADWLSREWGASVILAGRTIPTSAGGGDSSDASVRRHDAIAAIRGRGAGVTVIQADVATEAGAQGLRAALASTPLDGLFYVAGAMSPTSTLSLTPSLDEYRVHLRSKTLGLAHVDEAFRDADLDFRVVFSSISTVLGGLGHCGYAASNLAVDLLTEQWNQSRSRAPWLSIDWDLWRTERSLASATQRSALQTAITPDEGLSLLPDLLRLGRGRLVVSTTDLAARIAKWVRLEPAPADPAAAAGERAGGDARQPAAAAQADWQGDVEKVIGGIWLEALGLDVLKRDDDYFDAGGDSLTGVRIVARINEEFDVELSLEEMLEARTVRGAGELVDGLLLARRPPASQVAGVRPAASA